MQRQRKILKEGSCRDIVLDVEMLKEDNSCRKKKKKKKDVATRNDCFIN